ncbi:MULTISPECIES: hypothetical protein [Paenibacillus]|uniref:hypothetical protein n=1 Tax=Paenibacillus TaxID=44249 RepID=UPI0015C62474|nr:MULTISPECIES: hypothetical protein [Paenibacillus]
MPEDVHPIPIKITSTVTDPDKIKVIHPIINDIKERIGSDKIDVNFSLDFSLST